MNHLKNIRTDWAGRLLAFFVLILLFAAIPDNSSTSGRTNKPENAINLQSATAFAIPADQAFNSVNHCMLPVHRIHTAINFNGSILRFIKENYRTAFFSNLRLNAEKVDQTGLGFRYPFQIIPDNPDPTVLG